MTQKATNPLDKVVGLHVSLDYNDGVIINMTRRKAMEYIQTFEHMKSCEEMEDRYMIITSHRKSTEDFYFDNIQSMEIIPYDTIS